MEINIAGAGAGKTTKMSDKIIFLRNQIDEETGSLLTNSMMSGNNMLSLIAASVAAIGGIKDTVKLFGDVRERPGYFLWKLNKENKQNKR